MTKECHILTDRGGRNSSHITLVFYLDHWFIRHVWNDDLAWLYVVIEVSNNNVSVKGGGCKTEKKNVSCVCCVIMSHYRLSFTLTRTSLKLFSHLNCFSPFNYHRPSFNTILFGTKKPMFFTGEGRRRRWIKQWLRLRFPADQNTSNQYVNKCRDRNSKQVW